MTKQVSAQKHFGTEWQITENDNGSVPTPDAQLAVLMGIRFELQRLNRLLHCHNFMDIPRKLERIKRNTAKKRKPKAVGKPKLRVVRS